MSTFSIGPRKENGPETLLSGFNVNQLIDKYQAQNTRSRDRRRIEMELINRYKTGARFPDAYDENSSEAIIDKLRRDLKSKDSE